MGAEMHHDLTSPSFGEGAHEDPLSRPQTFATRNWASDPANNSGETLGLEAGNIFEWEAEPGAEGADHTKLLDELLRIHEYERQRIGQELHDSAGQLVVSLQLSVAHLRRVEENCPHQELIDDIQDTIRQIDQQIRALAFLHYPFELGDRSLCSAVQSLTMGFGRRTGIHTTFRCVGSSEPVDEAVSKAILRVAQEALVNIHRHSHASSAKVVLERRPDRLQLRVTDDGVGMAAEANKSEGIGLQGMRHRLQTVGGRFRIGNLKHGTRVAATVPIAAVPHPA